MLNEVCSNLYPNGIASSKKHRSRCFFAACLFTAPVALLMVNFSRSGKTVDEIWTWLKHICIKWVILNGLGFIIIYVRRSLLTGSEVADAE